MAQALDLYVNGSLNVFNHRTNVNIENRIVAFDIKELGKQLKKLGMLIVQDQIWGRVTQKTAAKARRRGTSATSSICFCERNRRRLSPARFGSVSENGEASPPGPPRTSRTYFLPRRSKTFWKTVTSFACSIQASGDRHIPCGAIEPIPPAITVCGKFRTRRGAFDL